MDQRKDDISHPCEGDYIKRMPKGNKLSESETGSVKIKYAKKGMVCR